MGGYLTLPDTVIDDPDAAVSWISRAMDHVAALTAKQPKAERATN